MRSTFYNNYFAYKAFENVTVDLLFSWRLIREIIEIVLDKYIPVVPNKVQHGN